MTTRASKWVEELVAEWIEKVNDEDQLMDWSRRCAFRAAAMRDARTLTKDQVADGLRRCKRGDVLYAERPVVFGGKSLMEVWFSGKCRNRNYVWIMNAPQRPNDGSKWTKRKLSMADATHYQLSRTDMTTRKRAPKEAA